jgi:signal transduction histidine kinase
MAGIARPKGVAYNWVTTHGFSAEFRDYVMKLPISPGRATVVGRALLEKRAEQIVDVLADSEYGYAETQKRGDYRSVLGVPLLREGNPIGAIFLARKVVQPFTDKQIELVTTFADQAVIAIENVRLFEEVQERTRELSESLEQQTATSEVLKVISSSPGDLKPVFETMLHNSVKICEAGFGQMFLYEGDNVRLVAAVGVPTVLVEFDRRRGTFQPTPGGGLDRVMRTKRVIHIADLTSEHASYPPAKLGGARSYMAVPMLKEDQLIGAIAIYRQEVQPFTDKQIELVQNFAAQAVIAIENARLLNELRQRTHELATSLDNLRTTQDRLVQTQKLASLGQLTAGIAHEIKNPLNFVNNFSGVSSELIDELQDTLKGLSIDQPTRAEINDLTNTLRANLDKIVQHGKRADGIVKNMLLHSREGSSENRAVDINALVEESLNLAYHGARAEKQGFNITLERSFDPTAGRADVFPQDLTRVLLNLISNGFYAAMKRKEVAGDGYEPTLMTSTRNLGEQVEIRVRDNGAGIPPEVKEKIFNPFFTTKPAGEGTGLGLSISHDVIVKQHGGSIDVETELGAFSEFIIVLPRAGAPLIKSGEP